MPWAMSEIRLCIRYNKEAFENFIQHGFCCYNPTSKYDEVGCALYIYSIYVGNRNHIGVVYSTYTVATVPRLAVVINRYGWQKIIILLYYY